jgi:hypothetical protein
MSPWNEAGCRFCYCMASARLPEAFPSRCVTYSVQVSPPTRADWLGYGDFLVSLFVISHLVFLANLAAATSRSTASSIIRNDLVGRERISILLFCYRLSSLAGGLSPLVADYSHVPGPRIYLGRARPCEAVVIAQTLGISECYLTGTLPTGPVVCRPQTPEVWTYPLTSGKVCFIILHDSSLH